MDDPTPVSDRLARAALLVLLVATLATAWVERDLWSPDEQRYGQVGREMLHGGGLLIPHFGGVPYAEKPPAHFWVEALVSLPFGDVTSFSARATGCLFAALAFLWVFLLGRRWFRDERVGAVAALAFATNLLLLHNATRATMDLSLAFFVLLAAERGSAWLHRGGAFRALLFGLAWAAGVLTKGPMAALLPFFTLVGEAVFLPRRPAPRDPGWWLAPLVMVGGVLGWALPAAAAGGAAYEHRLFGQVVARASGAEGHHLKPWYWYLGVLGIVLLPWILHYLAGFLRAVTTLGADADDRPGLAGAAAAALLGLGILSAVATKREVYLITPMPFMALTLGLAVRRHFAPRLLAAGRGLLLVGPILGAFLVLALPFVGTRFFVIGEPWPETLFDPARFLKLLPALVVFLGGFAWAWRARRDDVRLALRVGVVLAVGTLGIKAAVLPEVDELKSFGRVAALARETAGEERIVVAGPVWRDWLWNLRRGRVDRAEDLPALVALAEGRAGGTVAIVEQRWWREEHAKVDDETRARVARLFDEVGRRRAEHRTYLVFEHGRDP